MNNGGWTGGQYSVFRALLGLYLVVHFVQLLPSAAEYFSNQGHLADANSSPFLNYFPNIFDLWGSPTFVTVVAGVAVFLSVLLVIGYRDRCAAILLCYILACMFGRNSLIIISGLPFIGLLLLIHAALPSAPYGSFAARGRVDPAGGWKMPQPIFLLAWIVLALGYSYSGYTKLINPSWRDGSAFPMSLPEWLLAMATWGVLSLELAFAPLVLLQRLRPWLWLSMLLMQLSLMVLIDFAALSMGMLALHLFTFDPNWLRAKAAPQPEFLFYDGGCGLCHRALRLVLAEENGRTLFRFAPLGGQIFAAEVPVEIRSELPDSLLVKTSDDNFLMRTNAICHILDRLGGGWKFASKLLRWIPLPIRDWGYNFLARIRHRLFRRPTNVCPLLPEALQKRFEL